jgi:hypothetical protein
MSTAFRPALVPLLLLLCSCSGQPEHTASREQKMAERRGKAERLPDSEAYDITCDHMHRWNGGHTLSAKQETRSRGAQKVGGTHIAQRCEWLPKPFWASRATSVVVWRV